MELIVLNPFLDQKLTTVYGIYQNLQYVNFHIVEYHKRLPQKSTHQHCLKIMKTIFIKNPIAIQKSILAISI